MPQVAVFVAQYAVAALAAVGASAGVLAVVGNFVIANFWRMVFVLATVTYSSIQQRKSKASLNKGRVYMVREAAYPRQLIYGQIKTSGPMVFIDVTGTKNEYVHMIIALAGHQVEEITSVYFNDTLLTLDGDGEVTNSPFAGYARVKKHLGSPTQTADADLVSDSARWTSEHRLRGIAYVYVRLKWNAEKFPSGWPNVSALVKGKLVYDYRTSTTAYSANWALCLADYLTSPLGLGDLTTRLDQTYLNAAANVADEEVTLSDASTEKRYAVGGAILSNTAPGDAIEQMTASGAGFCGFIGGKWVIHAGAYRTPTVTIDESYLIGPVSIQTRVSKSEIFNAGKGVYIGPETDWQPADYPAITNATYLAADNGVQIWRDFEWAFVTSNGTAQRLTKMNLERVRQEIAVELKCNLGAANVQAGDNIMVTLARYGWTSKVFEVVNSTFVPRETDGAYALGYDLTLRETASAVWDWSNGEETTVDPAPNTNLPNPRTVAAPTSVTLTSGASTTSLQADGTVVPRIKVEFTAPADEFVNSGGRTWVEYKLNAATEWNHVATLLGDEEEMFITAIVTGQNYDVRLKSVNTLGVSSAWTPTESVVAAGDTSTPSAPSSGGVSSENVVPSVSPGTGELQFGCRLYWDPTVPIDFSHWEIKVTNDNSDDSITYTWSSTGWEMPLRSVRAELLVYTNPPAPTSGHARVRIVDNSGNFSPWKYLGQCNSATTKGAATMATQNRTDAKMSGRRTGNSDSATKIVADGPVHTSGTLTGGAVSEIVSVSLPAGFTTKPDGPDGGKSTASNGLLWRYDWDHVDNTSSSIRIYFYMADGSNITASLSYRIAANFYQNA